MIFKITIIAVIVVAGWVAVFNIPETVESFLPVVETTTMTLTEYNPTVSGTGIISRKIQDDTDDWFVTVSIGEGDIRHVEIGQEADLRGAAFDDDIYTATVYEVATTANTQRSEFTSEVVVEVTLQIDNPDEELRPGYTARAEIKTDEMREIFIIPYSAVLQDDVSEFVYVLSGNTALRRDIVTGVELVEGVEVNSGLFEDEQIILTLETIEDNSLVKEEQN
jgi:hypothetical protein